MEFTYQNPIISNDLNNIRDPFIIKEKNGYYLTGSSAPFWKGKNAGVKIWRSKNLLDWEYLGLIIDSRDIPENAWYKERFWAPEIAKISGKYYLTVNCRNEKYDKWHSVFIAVADKITGPYTFLTVDRPALIKADVRRADDNPMAGIANDGSLFYDNGHTYLSFSNRYGIFAYEIELPSCKLVGEMIHLVKPSSDDWDTKIEAPYIIKQNSVYYCFYSSFTRSYEVGIACSDSMYGEWKKYKENPIITPKSPVTACGHNCVFTGPDNKLWTAYHMTTINDNIEHLAIDKIEFTADGKIITFAPTMDKQKIELNKKSECIIDSY